MIALTDPIRHALAGVLASAAFLTLFFVLSLKAIAAIPVALIVYIGALFATPRRAPPGHRSGRPRRTGVQSDVERPSGPGGSRPLS